MVSIRGTNWHLYLTNRAEPIFANGERAFLPMNTPRGSQPERRLTALYIVALGMIAVLTVLGYGLERIRRPRASDAQLIVAAARQRMLGQQITKAALAAASATDVAARERHLAELDAAIGQLQLSQQLLRFGDRQQGLPAETDQKRLETLRALDVRLQALVQESQALAAQIRHASPPPSSDLDAFKNRLLAAESRYTGSATDVVSRYAQDASAHVKWSDRIELALMAAMLTVLLWQGAFVFAPAVREVRDAIAALEDTQVKLASLAAIVESSSDAIAGTSLTGEIQSWNKGAERMFGRTAADMRGRNISSILHSKSTAAAAALLGKVAAGETTAPFDAVATGPDGRRIDVSLMMSPVTAADGRERSLAVIGRDITDRVLAQKMKSDFVSFVSHQLRTPLAGIKWMLELAAENRDVSPQTAEYVSGARESAERLIHLVNDLLDVARLEEGRLTVTPQAVRIEDVTRSVIAEMDGLVHQKSIAFGFTSEPNVPPVMVDLQLIRQALGNLISNAVKYTPSGGRIDLAIERQNGAVQWRIRDSGIGIPADAHARLFEKFFRADNAAVIETEGTGLGLYLVRLIATQFGGRVWCESEEGQGATFILTLPPRDIA